MVLNVRRYLSYKLSYRDLVAMMAERAIDLAHAIILRWVQHYTPNSRSAGTALRTEKEGDFLWAMELAHTAHSWFLGPPLLMLRPFRAK